MKVWRWVWIPILLVLVGACTTSSQPPEGDSPDLMHAMGSQAVHEGPKLTFIEPSIGSASEGVLDADLPLLIRIFEFAIDSDGLPTDVQYGALQDAFSTADGTIAISGDTFKANWQVPVTQNLPARYVRIEVQYAVGAADPDAPLCGYGAGGSCFGYFDARLDANSSEGKSNPLAGFLPIVRDRTLPIRFHIRESQSSAPDSINALRRISNNAPFNVGDDAEANCTQYDVPGQGLQAVGAGLQAVGAGLQAVGAGLQAVGAVGGMFYHPAFQADALVTPSTVATDIRSLAGASSATELLTLMVGDLRKPVFDERVALLVVDDFGSAAPYLLPEPEDLFEIGGDSFVLTEDVTHGALVMDHVLALLDAAFGVGERDSLVRRTDSPDGSDVLYAYAPRKGKKAPTIPLILVRAVNTRNETTDVIDTDVIKDEIEDNLPVTHGDLSYPNVIMNMSFAIVPCAASSDAEASAGNLTDIDGDGVVSLDDYMAALALTNDVVVAEQGELTQLATSALNDDLLTFLRCPAGEDGCARAPNTGIVKVAASGNFGYAFPFAPAALESVASVSSQDTVAEGYGGKSSFSNGGEIMTPGSLFLASADAVPEGTTVAAIAYAGTSFSAPNVSVFSALDLAQGDARQCAAGTTSEAAELAVADANVDDSDNLPLGSIFIPTTSSATKTALGEYCP